MHIPRRTRWVVPITIGTVIAGGLVIGGTLQAQEPPPPIAVEVLTQRAVFTDDVSVQIRNKLDGHATGVSNAHDPSRTVVARITVQPGARFPWHTHPGPVIVNIAQGELIYTMAHDCVDRSYPAGTAFVDPGHGMVHTAVNPTDEATVLLATFFEVPETGPLTIPVAAPADCTP
jgi:quercetin dioxygenase-like cupin family protein